jgi:hypothetical protein
MRMEGQSIDMDGVDGWIPNQLTVSGGSLVAGDELSVLRRLYVGCRNLPSQCWGGGTELDRWLLVQNGGLRLLVHH